jgi:hypothetical protein
MQADHGLAITVDLVPGGMPVYLYLVHYDLPESRPARSSSL